MRHVLSSVVCCALVGALAPVVRAEDKPEWVTIKGQVVFPKDTKFPTRAPLNVAQDKQHCLGKGAILDESVIVNAKNRGVKNVVVYLRPDSKEADAAFTKEQIHPADAKRKPAEVVIDQPCCMFVPRVVCARVGDTIVVKNPSPVAHNFFWDSAECGTHNPTIAAKTDWKMPNVLKKEPGPIQYKCSIHPWMSGYVRTFDHPYYAVTDDDGKFEIKNAPAGKFRIVFWHENGLRGGREGRFGEVIEIKGTCGTMEMKPTDFDVSPKN
jgi:plastocyanin